MANKSAQKISNSSKKSRAVDLLADEVAPWWNKTYVTVGKKEVDTWKGALALMFIAGIVSSLIWSVKTKDYNASSAAAASTLAFSPATLTTTNGASFILTPTIVTGVNKVSIVALRITFDKTKLALDTITPSATFGTAESATTINNTTGIGIVDLSVGTANASVSGTFAVAALGFHSIATGSASVAFTGAAGTSGAAADSETGNVVMGTTPITVTVNAVDTTPPTGGSITYVNAYQTTTSVALSAADGTDSGSGINTATRIVQRRSAALAAGTCGTYGSWSTIAQTGTYPNFIDATVASGNCYQYQYLVSDSAATPNQATYTSTNTVKIDTAAPAGGSIGYTGGYYTATSVALTASDGTDAASGINTGTRIVQRKSATLSAGTCGTYGSFAVITPTGSYPNVADSTVASGSCYQYQYLISDNAGNQVTYATANTAKIDTSSPTGGSMTYTDGYYGNVSVPLTVADGTDSASGINTGTRVVQRKSAALSAGVCGSYGSLSTISTTGTYPNFTDTTVGSGNCYQYQYLISNNAAEQATYTTTNTAKVDTAAPIGGSASIANGYNSSHTVVLTASDGTDAISSINTASRIVQRKSATLAAGACGAYGAWSTISPTAAYPTFTDKTVATGNCYQYQYQVSNAAGVQATYAATNTAQETYSADINQDGQVNYLDYGVMHSNYGNTTCGNVADIDGSCTVDYLDYGVMHSQYGDSLL